MQNIQILIVFMCEEIFQQQQTTAKCVIVYISVEKKHSSILKVCGPAKYVAYLGI